MGKFVWLFDTSFNTKRFNITLLVFRVLLSLSLVNTHGLKKVIHFEETLQHIPDPIGIGSELSAYIAIFSNIICPAFIIMGLFTRPFILPIVSTTLIGFFIVHGQDPWPIRDVPFMYSLSFLVLLVLGPGKYSVDQLISQHWLQK